MEGQSNSKELLVNKCTPECFEPITVAVAKFTHHSKLECGFGLHVFL